MSLISIVIPVYNHAHTLERCVRSLLNQTYQPLEIIIVNDGSTDNYAQIKNELSNLKTNKINFRFFDQANSGAPAARNRGFRESSGEYVMFYDADTIAAPDMLGKLVAALEKHPEASYAYSQFRFGWKLMKLQNFNSEDLKRYNYIDTMSLVRREALVSLLERRVAPQGRDVLSPYINKSNDVTHPGSRELATPLSRGELSDGPFDESLKRFQDWDLWLTLLEHGKTGVFVPEVLRHVLVARKGMSSWLPRFVYKLPWKIKKVRDYDAARLIVMKKHHLL